MRTMTGVIARLQGQPQGGEAAPGLHLGLGRAGWKEWIGGD